MNKKTLVLISWFLLVGMLFALPAGAAGAAALQTDISPARYEEMVKDTLAAMERAYEQEQLRKFMDLVSPDFSGDDFLIYRAVRRDFRFFDDIKLYLYLDSFSVDAKGRAQAAVKYNRSVIANKDSRSYKDSGLTQMTFVIEDGKAKLYDMKFPMIFGLSEGLQLTTGIVRTAETSRVMVVDRRGNVYVLPFREAMDIANGTSVLRGMMYLSSTAGAIQGVSLADNAKVTGGTLQGDFGWDTSGYLILKPGTRYLALPDWSFDSTNQAPDPATGIYSSGPMGAPALPGWTFALQLAGSNKFAIIEIQSVSSDMVTTTGVIRYKYQPSGSRFF